MKRPNILLLYTDQQRHNALGFDGNKDIQALHLNRLAAKCVNLDHYFVQNSVCMPSGISGTRLRYARAPNSALAGPHGASWTDRERTSRRH